MGGGGWLLRLLGGCWEVGASQDSGQVANAISALCSKVQEIKISGMRLCEMRQTHTYTQNGQRGRNQNREADETDSV